MTTAELLHITKKTIQIVLIAVLAVVLVTVFSIIFGLIVSYFIPGL